MNVTVTAQTLSCSVASTITFVRENNDAEFHDSIATTEFVLLMNNLFDILNSKSKFGRGYKAPLSLENYSEICKYLTDGIDILESLTDTDGVKIICGSRKTYVEGFVISAKSILAINQELMLRDNNPYSCCRASARQHTILDGTSLRVPSLVDQLESRNSGGLRKLIMLAGHTGSSDRMMHMCFFPIL